MPEGGGRQRQGGLFTLPRGLQRRVQLMGAVSFPSQMRAFQRYHARCRSLPPPQTWGTDQYLVREEAGLRLDSQGMGIRGGGGG